MGHLGALVGLGDWFGRTKRSRDFSPGEDFAVGENGLLMGGSVLRLSDFKGACMPALSFSPSNP